MAEICISRRPSPTWSEPITQSEQQLYDDNPYHSDPERYCDYLSDKFHKNVDGGNFTSVRGNVVQRPESRSDSPVLVSKDTTPAVFKCHRVVWQQESASGAFTPRTPPATKKAPKRRNRKPNQRKMKSDSVGLYLGNNVQNAQSFRPSAVAATQLPTIAMWVGLYSPLLRSLAGLRKLVPSRARIILTSAGLRLFPLNSEVCDGGNTDPCVLFWTDQCAGGTCLTRKHHFPRITYLEVDGDEVNVYSLLKKGIPVHGVGEVPYCFDFVCDGNRCQNNCYWCSRVSAQCLNERKNTLPGYGRRPGTRRSQRGPPARVLGIVSGQAHVGAIPRGTDPYLLRATLFQSIRGLERLDVIMYNSRFPDRPPFAIAHFETQEDCDAAIQEACKKIVVQGNPLTWDYKYNKS